jgi:hypothetical protein
MCPPTRLQGIETHKTTNSALATVKKVTSISLWLNKDEREKKWCLSSPCENSYNGQILIFQTNHQLSPQQLGKEYAKFDMPNSLLK